MMPIAPALDTLPKESDDLFFKCEHCGTSLVVDQVAAGMTLACQSCRQPTTVPRAVLAGNRAHELTQNVAEQLAELERHLKENESQRTEIGGYINQHSIQLHRWQLRLQTLNERNKELMDGIAALTGRATP